MKTAAIGEILFDRFPDRDRLGGAPCNVAAMLSQFGLNSFLISAVGRDRLAELLGAGQGPRSIDVQVTRLRKKIERDSKNPRYLQTVRGKGYMLLTE